MRVTIKGLTDSTITFNTTGIILRGNSANPVLYPNSIATHIDIKTDEQMRELITLKNANLISVEDESESVTSVASVSTKDIAIEPIEPIEPIESVVTTKVTGLTQPEPPEPPKPPLEETVFIPNDEIEDMPLPPPNDDDEEFLTIYSSTDIVEEADIDEEVVEFDEDVITEVEKAPKTAKIAKTAKKGKKTTKGKAIKRSKNTDVPAKEKLEKESKEDPDSKIVVMTPNGPVESNSANSFAGEMPESDATKASIEALRQMEDEEAEPESLIDESKLDPSERMGVEAVIATGESNMAKVPMKNSILPEADAIKERGINFIDPTGEDGPIDHDALEDELDESIKDIFIDNDEDGIPDDDTGDDFIEC